KENAKKNIYNKTNKKSLQESKQICRRPWHD
ncbi:hypothetical protein, partial [Pseudomonas sp. NPDC089406]